MWMLVFIIISAGQGSFYTKTFTTQQECDEAEKNLPNPPNMVVLGKCIDLVKVLGKEA